MLRGMRLKVWFDCRLGKDSSEDDGGGLPH
jgi:hypothetical protein